MKVRHSRGVFVASLMIGTCGLMGCATSSTRPTTIASSERVMTVAADGYGAADALFAQPYIDVQEWRSSPVRHYYVHGGFRGTQTRFSYYLPPSDIFEGRFFQHVTPVPLNENLAQADPVGKFNKIGFSAASGAYFVETNGGVDADAPNADAGMPDSSITAYRANAAAALFSRHVAQQFYGKDRRIYGYIYGGSGGAYRTIGSLENTEGVWDGGVPYVNGSTMAIPNMFTVRMQALRVLRKKFPQIVDALEPGGSGDAYAGLSAPEETVLHEAENMGFPMASWFGWKTMGLHGFAALYGGIKQVDGSYFTDFWTKPGYLGYDRPELFAADRVQFDGKVVELVTARMARASLGDESGSGNKGGVDDAFRLLSGIDGDTLVGVRLDTVPVIDYFMGGDLTVRKADGSVQSLLIEHIDGNTLYFGLSDSARDADIGLGDMVNVDNSNFLAIESYHRHQVPKSGFPVWDQFRDAEGEPIYPQRPMIVGPLFVQSTAGSQLTGDLGSEKVVLAASLWDREAMPWQADWYRRRVEAQNPQIDKVRVYYTERALHGDQMANEDPSRIVSYQGPLQQSLRLLADWVEDGIAPPESSQYRIANGQVIVSGSGNERLGLQPTVTLTANGTAVAHVKSGEQIRLEAVIDTPPGGGTISDAGWDIGDRGIFEAPRDLPIGQARATLTRTVSFDRPGTYFVGLRATTQASAAKGTPYAELVNIGRVRIVVGP